jgi:dephospho-CoA kinase
MQVIGVLGGVASGKSLVAHQLARLGAGVLDADGAGHEVLRLPSVESAARDRWGEEIFGADGRIDRARLARLVFGPSQEAAEERAYLEHLTHPEIGRRLAEQARRLAESGAAVVVLDAPLLLEAGWDSFCDTLVFVDAPRPLRAARASARGWSEEEFAARESVQLPLERKRERADVVIDGSGSPESARLQVERLWRTLVG